MLTRVEEIIRNQLSHLTIKADNERYVLRVSLSEADIQKIQTTPSAKTSPRYITA